MLFLLNFQGITAAGERGGRWKKWNYNARHPRVCGAGSTVEIPIALSIMHHHFLTFVRLLEHLITYDLPIVVLP